jgi:hypothetical protein
VPRPDTFRRRISLLRSQRAASATHAKLDFGMTRMGHADALSSIVQPPTRTCGTLNDMSMSHFLRSTQVVCATVAFAAGISCSHGTVIGPSNGLQITSATPSQFTPSAIPQVVQFQGAGFDTGLILQVTDPTGAAVDILASQIQDLVSASFQASLVLAMNGTYGLVVQEPNGTVSASFPLNVGTGTTGSPLITNISPSSMTRSANPQSVSIAGSGFSTSPSVSILDPQDVSTNASGLIATDSSIQFSMVFNKAGLYTIAVLTPSGAISNSVTVSVQ